MKQLIILVILLGSILTTVPATGANTNWQKDVVPRKSKSFKPLFVIKTTKLRTAPNKTPYLDFGPALLQCKRSSQIKTPNCLVKLEKGAIALLVVSPVYTRVFNLHERWKDHVIVSVSGTTISVSPGQDVTILTSKNKSLARKIHLDDGIHRRNILDHQLPNQQFLITSDFSMFDIFKHNSLLHSAQKSKQRPCRKLVEKIVRTAVALQVSDRYKAPYILNESKR